MTCTSILNYPIYRIPCCYYLIYAGFEVGGIMTYVSAFIFFSPDTGTKTSPSDLAWKNVTHLSDGKKVDNPLIRDALKGLGLGSILSGVGLLLAHLYATHRGAYQAL